MDGVNIIIVNAIKALILTIYKYLYLCNIVGCIKKHHINNHTPLIAIINPISVCFFGISYDQEKINKYLQKMN